MSNRAQQMIDAAASEALGANSPAESAAYQQELTAAGDDARRLDRQLRETVARLASASPYMKPPADLRGKLLQATAPTTFRMEDYRKVTQETGRFYRWGFYAAVAFLAAGAWFNLSTQSKLQSTQGEVAGLVHQIKVRDTALSDLINPKADQIAITQDNKVAGKAFVNSETGTAVVVLPQGILPPGKTVDKMTMTRNGKTVTYTTVALTAPREAFPQWAGGAVEHEFRVGACVAGSGAEGV